MDFVALVSTQLRVDARLSDESQQERQFTFDYSFWSHDGFRTCSDTGQSIATDDESTYASQQYVYDGVGVEVLNRAWEGYHCCLFREKAENAMKTWNHAAQKYHSFYFPGGSFLFCDCDRVHPSADLIAYGQTGAGKSYSMVGYGANKGIVPMSCAEIFRRIKTNKVHTFSLATFCPAAM